jgi:hypothetical protein
MFFGSSPTARWPGRSAIPRTCFSSALLAQRPWTTEATPACQARKQDLASLSAAGPRPLAAALRPREAGCCPASRSARVFARGGGLRGALEEFLRAPPVAPRGRGVGAQLAPGAAPDLNPGDDLQDQEAPEPPQSRGRRPERPKKRRRPVEGARRQGSAPPGSCGRRPGNSRVSRPRTRRPRRPAPRGRPRSRRHWPRVGRLLTSVMPCPLDAAQQRFLVTKPTSRPPR